MRVVFLGSEGTFATPCQHRCGSSCPTLQLTEDFYTHPRHCQMFPPMHESC